MDPRLHNAPRMTVKLSEIVTTGTQARASGLNAVIVRRLMELYLDGIQVDPVVLFRDERGVILGVLATSYVTALALRIVINLAWQRFIDPTQHFTSIFDLFHNALLSTYLLLCWSAL